MIDSGSTHNVLHVQVAKRLHLKPHSDSILNVGVAGGRTVCVDQVCRDVFWTMNGHSFKSDFLVMDVGRFDVILGAQWLRQLGSILLNMDQQFLAFKLHDQYYELHGLKERRRVTEEVIGSRELLQAQHVYMVQVESISNSFSGMEVSKSTLRNREIKWRFY